MANLLLTYLNRLLLAASFTTYPFNKVFPSKKHKIAAIFFATKMTRKPVKTPYTEPQNSSMKNDPAQRAHKEPH